MKVKLILGLLIISVLGNILFVAFSVYQNSTIQTENLKDSNHFLKSELKASREEQKYILEVILNDGLYLQKSMPEYSDISKDKSEEALRQKIVKLKMQLSE